MIYYFSYHSLVRGVVRIAYLSAQNGISSMRNIGVTRYSIETVEL